MSLDILGWGKVSDFLTSILDRVVQDPQQKAQASLALAQLEQQGEFKLIDSQLQMMKGQTDINLEEAKSEHWWKSGARPFILWICGLGFLYALIGYPTLTWVSTNLWQLGEFPQINNELLSTTMWGMLGLGGLRSADKGTFSNIFKK